MATVKNNKEPLIRMAARNDIGPAKAWGIRLISLVVALLIGSIIFRCLGYAPVSVYTTMISGSLGDMLSVQQTLRIAIPLLGASIAVAPAFRMKFWNIGVEGQITMGAIFSSFFALNFVETWSPVVLIPVMFVAGALGGAVWGLIPAYFKAKWGTNETLFTLMLNYIAIGIVKYLQGGPWEGTPGSQIIPMFSANARMATIGKTTVGIFIILAFVILILVYMRFTKQGYQLSVVGESVNTAKYAGINVSNIICRNMAISGAIGGIVGFITVSGINYTLTDGVAGGVGFTGIAIAWLSQLNTVPMVIISMLLAVLEKGSSTLATLTGNVLSADISDVLTGLILFCMLGSEFFIRYRLIFRNKHKNGGAK